MYFTMPSFCKSSQVSQLEDVRNDVNGLTVSPKQAIDQKFKKPLVGRCSAEFGGDRRLAELLLYEGNKLTINCTGTDMSILGVIIQKAYLDLPRQTHSTNMYNGYRKWDLALMASFSRNIRAHILLPLSAPQGFHPQHQGQYPPYMPPQNGQGLPPGMMPMRPGMPMPTLQPQGGPGGGGGFPPPFASQDPRFRPAMPPFAPTGPVGAPGSQPSPMNMGLSPNANGLVQIPNVSPAAQSPATPMGFSNPLIGRPPPQGFGMRPAPGLGFNGQGQGQGPPGGPGFMIDHNAAGLPRPPHMMFPGGPGGPPQHGMGSSDNPNFVKPAVKTTAVFIGGIPDGITDAILTGLIQVRCSLPSSCHKY